VLRLHLHVHQNELRVPVPRLEPRDDIGLSHVALRDVGEDLLPEKAQGLEV
jgi:hypothetical protein